MRETVLLLLVAPWICVGCTTMVDVTVDPGEDLSRLHTWNWLPSGESPEMGVDAPHRNARELHARLGRLIDRQLRSQGFERAEQADFFVIYHLVLKQRRVIVQVPRAPYLLSSFSYSPSYWIEGSDEEIRVYEDFRLVIGLMRGGERMIWRGVLERKVEEGQALSLDDGVALLLERLPPAGSEDAADEGPRQLDAPREPSPSTDTASL